MSGSLGVGKWKREIRRGVIKMCVLALLSKKEMYGYEISKALSLYGNGVLFVKEGTLYPLLRRLEDDGYVVGEWRLVSGKARRYYRITRRGIEVLTLMKDFWLKLRDSVDKIFGLGDMDVF